MKKVSVIVPCYNASEFLDCCIEHILKQTIGIKNIELILVDDASTDDGATLELMMKYERQYPNEVMVIPLEQNMRQGGARNIGVSYASGEYLLFCDADDWLAIEALEILYNVATEYDADVVEFLSRDVTSNENPQLHRDEGEIKISMLDMGEKEKKKNLLLALTPYFTLGCWNKLYRSSLIKDNNIRFVEHLVCEEPSFTIPVRLYEKRHLFVDAVLHFCYLSPDSTMRGRWGDRKWDNMQGWLLSIKDLEMKGLLQEYYEEIGYLFFCGGFVLTIRMLFQAGYIMEKGELRALKDMVFQVWPNIAQNRYLQERKENNALWLEILYTEITDENIGKYNQMIKRFLFNIK